MATILDGSRMFYFQIDYSVINHSVLSGKNFLLKSQPLGNWWGFPTLQCL